MSDYIRIQKARYRDRITAEIDIPEELFQYQIPKLILQPIVENAFVHGLEMKRGKGLLTITGCRSGGTITVRVCDNGIGMSQEQIDRILNQSETSDAQTIGLGNVHRRLRLLYGGSYGVRIQSAADKGTAVTLTFPVRENTIENMEVNRNVPSADC